MKSISEEELRLAGYTWDQNGLRTFERPYVVPSLLAILLFIFVFVLMWRDLLSTVTGVVAIFGICAALGTMIAVMYFSSPKSPTTGHPLKKFRNASPEVPGIQIIYVDPEAKTYFKRTFVEPGYGD